MADWTTITDTQVDPDAPLTSGLAYAWRDNPIAIAEGATGAPRIRGEAAMPISQFPVLTVSASNAYDVSFGLNIVDGTSTTSSSTMVEAIRYTVNKFTGTMRFKARQTAGGGGASTMEITKNGTLVNSWTTSGTALRTEDIAIVPGDVIRWRHLAAGGTGTSNVSEEVPSASDAYVPVDFIARASAL